MNKKGQGLSMNTIIIAAIALLVLVVVSVIFIQQMGWFNTKSQDCQSISGVCQQDTCSEGFVISPKGTCYDAAGEKDTTKVCCTNLS